MIKLYGTLGPACHSTDVLYEMIQNGMTGIRINLSHGDITSFDEYLKNLECAEQRSGKKIDLVIDMEGPEMRVGTLTDPLRLSDEDIVELGTDIPLDKSILNDLETGMVCRLDDGKIEVEIVAQTNNGFKCKVIRGGVLLSRKSFTVIGKSFTRPLLTERDLNNLNKAARYGVSAILQPFVHTAKDVYDVKEILYQNGCANVLLMAKIEDEIGIGNMEEIVSATDIVVFARGDLGNNIDMWKLPKLQKRLAAVCKKQGKPFIIATQLLASMEYNPTPTRAEMNDIFNCAMDGAYGLMLTGETAAGKYPSRAMYFLGSAAKEAE